MSTDGLQAALDGAARGDEAALTTLYRAINPLLLRYLRHHVGREAEDVASEVWLALAPQLDGFLGTTSELRALMFTVARCRVVDQYRRNGRRPLTIPFEEDLERMLSDPPCIDDTEEIVVERISAQAAVEALVHVLPPDQAEIVLLRVLADLDVAQVAVIVDKSVGAVRVAQHRALQRLQRTGQRKPVTQ